MKKFDGRALFEIKTRRNKYMVRARNLMEAIDYLENRFRCKVFNSYTSTSFIRHKFYEVP